MVYIAGEESCLHTEGYAGDSHVQEMSRYTMELIMDKWVKPSVDISKWEFYDLSCKDRMSHSISSINSQEMPRVST